MSQTPYPYEHEKGFYYTFKSEGEKPITKAVIFAPTSYINIFNIGFGDLLEDGKIDDKANSNNGDMIKVLSTIIQILRDFSAEHQLVKVLFAGSTPNRTRFYERILKTYYDVFAKEFDITALIKTTDGYAETKFESNIRQEYFAFFIKRIN